MKKYCVAYVSFFDNVLKQELVESTSEYQALYNYMFAMGYRGLVGSTVEYLADYAFNCDALVSVIEIK